MQIEGMIFKTAFNNMKEECMKVKTICLQIMCEQKCGKIIYSFFMQKFVASYLINCYYGKRQGGV